MNIFTIYSLFYSLLINIVYFSSKRLRSIENKIFEKIMLTNFVGVLLAIGSYFTIKNIDRFELLNTFISKGYIIYLLTWLTLFSVYIFVISIKDGKDKKSAVNKIINLFGILYLIFLIIIIIKPLYYHNIKGAIYSYGPSANVMYIVSIVYITVWLIRLSTNIKRIRDKKYLPIFAFMGLGLVVMIIQKQHPELLLMTSMETFIVFLMYHTIENPDMQIIEEVHRAKEISDNANEEKSMFLYNMTNEILDISQMDSNIKIYNDKYNVKIIIKELVQIYKKKAEDKGISFRTNIASDIPPYLYGDSMGLKKALSIILDNSVKYTSSGFIDFDVSTIIKRDIARLVITVEDSGSGIKAEDLNKIFNKKVNDNERLNIKYNLYNAKRLVILMGGTIIPSSVYGRGTTIKVVLDQKIADMDDALDKYESVYDKKSILLVDDNVSSGKIFTKMLKDTNIELSIVTSGKECLDKIRNKDKYDLILLDEDMEPLDGITVMRKLKEIRTFNTKTILLTKNNDYEYNDDYLEYGFDGYLLKPIDKDKLFELIDKYLK